MTRLQHEDRNPEFRDILTDSTDIVESSYITGANQVKALFQRRASGKLEWGPGSTTPVDTNLYRFEAEALKTDGTLYAGGSLTASQNVVAAGQVAAGSLGFYSETGGLAVSLDAYFGSDVNATGDLNTEGDVNADGAITAPDITAEHLHVWGDVLDTVTLSGGWGADATVNLLNGPTDSGGYIGVAAAGAGIGANPTVTITWQRPYTGVIPKVVTTRFYGNGYQPSVPFIVQAAGTNSCTLMFLGTPIAGQDYEFCFMVTG